MDHPCYKCGQSTEDGKAFCLQCGAPQIRVAIPETGSSDAELLPPHGSDFSSMPSALPILVGPSGIVWPRALRVCLASAGIAVLLITLRVMIPILAVFGTGFLAVLIYRGRNPAWRAAAGSGAQLGALSGLIFTGISGVFAAILVAVLRSGGQASQQMLEAARQMASRSNDPQLQAAFELFKSPDTLAAKLIGGFVVLLLISLAAGGLGGALTGAFLGRKRRP